MQLKTPKKSPALSQRPIRACARESDSLTSKPGANRAKAWDIVTAPKTYTLATLQNAQRSTHTRQGVVDVVPSRQQSDKSCPVKRHLKTAGSGTCNRRCCRQGRDPTCTAASAWQCLSLLPHFKSRRRLWQQGEQCPRLRFLSKNRGKVSIIAARIP